MILGGLSAFVAKSLFLRIKGNLVVDVKHAYSGHGSFTLRDLKIALPDAEYQQQWGLAGKTVIGFIGSFYRYEGLDLLVRAFADACRERKDAVLLLVGGGETEDELKKLVEELELGDRVIMPGRIPHERIPGVYALVDVLAYPRNPMRLTELVTPLKPLEAMAMGKVLIASDVGGHRELIQHGQNGLLFPAGNGDALAQALSDVLSDTQLCDHIRAHAPEWVVKYHSWQKTTAVYRDIYAKALHSEEILEPQSTQGAQRKS